jgi:hypothetical protein
LSSQLVAVFVRSEDGTPEPGFNVVDVQMDCVWLITR